MKKYFYLFAIALLPMMFTSCGDEEENITPQNQQDGNTSVVVDENGNANNGHRFTKIDDKNFYIDDIKYTASQGNLVVSSYNSAYFSGEANIISTLKYDGRTMNVTGIKGSAFKNCTILTSISIPNSVTSIGGNAFYNCSNLTSVAIGDGVTSIGAYAFYSCSGLTTITIPNSVTSIGNDAFQNCSGLTSVTIPNSVTSIGYQAFLGCKNLTSVTIGNSVAKIAFSTFMDCSGLTSVTIGNSVASIEYDAFYSCSRIKTVTCYATTPPSIGSEAFNTSKITSATLRVPAKSVNTYKNTEYWKKFGSIVSIE